MLEHFEINEDTLYLLDNQPVKSFFDKEKISKWLGKNNNDYSITVLSDKPINWTGVFLIEKIWTGVNALFKYLVYKTKDTGFNTKGLMTDDWLNELNLNYEKGEMTIWKDIETWELHSNLIDKWMHTAVFWITNSWKTVTLKFLLYQIAKYKYSEFILLWKWDLLALSWSPKVKYANSVKAINKSEFTALINYIWLNVADRENKLWELWYSANYEEYKKNVMLKDPNALQIPHLVLVIDEFESLRENVWAELAWGVNEFDKKLKAIANYVRAYWILMYFASQNYIKDEIWIMRDYTQNQLIWFSKNVQPQYINTDKSNLINSIAWTYLFYSSVTDSFLKIPFDSPLEINKKIIQASKDNLLFKDKPEYYKQYEHTYQMINDLIFKIDSDIFKFIENIYKYFKLWDEYEKILKTSEFIPFSILVYAIFIMLKEQNIWPNVNIYPSPDFVHKIDIDLYNDNKDFYNEKWKSPLLEWIKALYKEWAADKDEFIDTLHDLLVSHINTITLDTDLSDMFGNEDNNKEIEKEELEREIKKKDNEGLLMHINYNGEIKPVSFNSMYYIEKLWWKIRKTSEAAKYEQTIKTKIVNKMNATQQPQVNTPVLLEIEFTLWVPVKKDWMLSKVGRNDLDNLLKATIDWINWTIINDDKQVYWIKTKVKYIEKQSSIFKNNKVDIKVYDFNQEVVTKYKNIFEKESKLTPMMTFKIQKWSKINIPSVNTMYFISEWKKKITSNALEYKSLLKNYINEYKHSWNVNITSKDVLIYIEFHIPESNNRDLDNMLKATIDSYQSTIIENDNQVMEIMCFKSELKEKDSYKWKIKTQLYIYNPIKDLIINEPTSNTNNINENIIWDFFTDEDIDEDINDEDVINKDVINEDVIDEDIMIGNQNIDNMDINTENVKLELDDCDDNTNLDTQNSSNNIETNVQEIDLNKNNENIHTNIDENINNTVETDLDIKDNIKNINKEDDIDEFLWEIDENNKNINTWVEWKKTNIFKQNTNLLKSKNIKEEKIDDDIFKAEKEFETIIQDNEKNNQTKSNIWWNNILDIDKDNNIIEDNIKDNINNKEDLDVESYDIFNIDDDEDDEFNEKFSIWDDDVYDLSTEELKKNIIN